MLQDRKYDFQDGKVINRQSGEAIPDDEPVFVFRARDHHAINILRAYRNRVNDEEQVEAITVRINDFQEFEITHPDRMKEPDTQLSLWEV